MTAAEIAALVAGSVVGDSAREVSGVASPGRASSSDLVFAVDGPSLWRALAGEAGVVLVGDGVLGAAPPADSGPESAPDIRASETTDNPGRTFVLVPDARRAFAQAAAALVPDPDAPSRGGIHPRALIDPDAILGARVTVGPGAVLEAAVSVDADAVIHAGCVLRSGARVGARSILHPRVTLYGPVVVGADCVLHAGSVLGSPGFGVVPSKDGPVDVPQLGRVVLGDRVHVGANCAIDRGALDDTTLADDVRLDNLVHVGHGARIGAGAIVAGQSGLAGRAELGAGSQVAGQVGIDVGARVGDGVQLGSRTWVLPGQVVTKGAWLGSPAAPLGEGRRRLAAGKRLPELLKRVRELEAQVAALMGEE